MTSPDVIVIGAGVAGLRAAVELSARGARVRVLEAKAVLGGRATSFVDPQTGERVDNGQHVLVGCYRETFGFLATIGTDDRVRVQPNLDVEFVDRTGRPQPPAVSVAAGADQPARRAAGLGRARLGPIDWRRPMRMAKSSSGRRRLRDGGAVADQQRPDRADTRDAVGAAGACRAESVGARGGARPPFAARAVGHVRRGTARRLAWLAAVSRWTSCSPSRRGASSRHAAANVRIGAAAQSACSKAVRRCRSTSRRAASVCDAGAVVCAVPWHALPDLFAGDTAPIDGCYAHAAATQAVAHRVASTSGSIGRSCRRRFSDCPGERCSGCSTSSSSSKGTSHLTMVSSGADEVMALSNEALTQVALRELRGALPESAIGARAARHGRPGTARDIFSGARPAEAAGDAGRTFAGLVLAGDWIETGLPATIEGAAISGRMAAEALS